MKKEASASRNNEVTFRALDPALLPCGASPVETEPPPLPLNSPLSACWTWLWYKSGYIFETQDLKKKTQNAGWKPQSARSKLKWICLRRA